MSVRIRSHNIPLIKPYQQINAGRSQRKLESKDKLWQTMMPQRRLVVAMEESCCQALTQLSTSIWSKKY